MMPPAHSFGPGPATREDRRPLYWTIAGIVAVLVLTGVIGAWKAVERIYDYRPAASELPAAEKAYRATGLPWTAKDLAQRPTVDPEENAGPMLRAAAAAVAKQKWNADTTPLRDAESAGDWAELARLLKRHEPVLARFEAAAKRPRADFQRDWDLGVNVLFPEFAGIRAAVRSLGHRAVLRAVRGDSAGARADLQTARSLARLANSDKVLISMLVSIACQAIADDATQRVAAKDPELAAVLARDLEEAAPTPELLPILRSEAYMVLATARNLKGQLSLTDLPADAEKAFEKMGMQTDPARLVRDGAPEGRDQRAFFVRALQLWTRAHAESQKHRNDPVALGKALDVLEEAESKKRGASYKLNQVMFPIFGQAGATVARARAGRAITLAYLRALEHRRRTGAFPRVLMTGSDPYGRPYVARREGAGFRIYSLGANGQDDGGLTAAERANLAKKSDDVSAVFPPPVRKRSSESPRKAIQ